MLQFVTMEKGDKKNRLTLIKLSKGGRRTWVCVCDCGNIKNILESNIVRGHTKSCGCLKGEKISAFNRSHSMTGTRIYRIWSGIKKRCDNKNCAAYKWYGAKGISYCKKWRTFEGFYDDMAIDYKSNLSIDRINSSGNYSRENCRWATPREQVNNSTAVVNVTIGGETKSIAQWCRDSNISYNTIMCRVNQKGMTHKEAITKPIRAKRRTDDGGTN